MGFWISYLVFLTTSNHLTFLLKFQNSHCSNNTSRLVALASHHMLAPSTGRVCCVVSLALVSWFHHICIQGLALVFAKAWFEISAESTVVWPWDRGCWEHIVTGKSFVSLKPSVFKRSLPPSVLHESHPEVPPGEKYRFQKVVATSWRQVVTTYSDDSWTELRDAQIQKAWKRWLDVLLQIPYSCAIVSQLEQFGSVTEQLRKLRGIFIKKAPQTLLKRCPSFLRFVKNLKETGEIFPGTEPGFYSFMCKLRDADAPISNLQIVVQALNFVHHLLGLPDISALTMSRRCTGAVGSHNAGPRWQAHPFKVVETTALLSVLIDCAANPWNRVFPGTVPFAIYRRSRWMDMQHVKTMAVDADFAGTVTYVELPIAVHKCQESTAFRNTLLTAVTPSFGAVDEPWVQAWLDVRNQLGIDFTASMPTMPAPNSEGEPTKRPLNTDKMKKWLFLLLDSKGTSLSGRRLTSHSCQCTVLSWLAKRGADWAGCMTLGGHVSFMRFAIVYSRNAIARPIRALESLLLDVRLGRFAPGETRSGRFKSGPISADADILEETSWSLVDGGLDPFSLPREPSSSAPVDVIDVDAIELCEVKHEEPEQHESSRSDSDAHITSSSEDEDGAQYKGASRPMRVPRVPASIRLTQHTKYKTLHLMERQNMNVTLRRR